MILVDSNILIDLFVNDPRWMLWSRNAIALAGSDNELIINQIVVAEVAPQFAELSRFLAWIARFEMSLIDFDSEAAFCSGLAFKKYRDNRKMKPHIGKSILPDFMIGGHAQSLGATILTRDPRFYRAYFPDVPLICPTKDDHD